MSVTITPSELAAYREWVAAWGEYNSAAGRDIPKGKLVSTEIVMRHIRACRELDKAAFSLLHRAATGGAE